MLLSNMIFCICKPIPPPSLELQPPPQTALALHSASAAADESHRPAPTGPAPAPFLQCAAAEAPAAAATQRGPGTRTTRAQSWRACGSRRSFRDAPLEHIPRNEMKTRSMPSTLPTHMRQHSAGSGCVRRREYSPAEAAAAADAGASSCRLFSPDTAQRSRPFAVRSILIRFYMSAKESVQQGASAKWIHKWNI